MNIYKAYNLQGRQIATQEAKDASEAVAKLPASIRPFRMDGGQLKARILVEADGTLDMTNGRIGHIINTVL